VVVKVLQRAGHNVIMQDRRTFGARSALDLRLIHAAAPADRALLEAVAANPSGVIEVVTADGVAPAVALLCRIHVDARIIVAAATLKRVRELHRVLEDALGFHVPIVQGTGWR
jgi:hypothetical protein